MVLPQLKRFAKRTANRLLEVGYPLLPTDEGRLTFVLGHDRSGTTWVGRTLGLAPRSIYVHEPINPDASFIGDRRLYNRYLPPGASSQRHARIFDRAVRGIAVRPLSLGTVRLRLLSRPNIVVKETGAMLLGEWLQSRYGGHILIVLRHPAAVVLSNIKNNPDNARQWFSDLESQKEELGKLIGEIPELSTPVEDLITAFTAIYCVRYRVLHAQLSRNPDWHLVRYETLCADPIGTFQELYARCNLELTDAVLEKLRHFSNTDGGDSFYGTERLSREMPTKWKRHCDSETERKIRHALEEFSFPYYQEEKDWDLPTQPKQKAIGETA